MELSDVILVTIETAGGQLVGRTVLQKLVYFASVKGLADVPYRPHYYGPFSQPVVSTLNTLVALNFVTEDLETGMGEPGDWRRFTYRLTNDGKAIAQVILGEHPNETRQLRELVKTAKRVSGLDPKVLSYAAKAHFILKSQGQSMTADQIREIAPTPPFGWSLESGQVERPLEVLEALQLVMKKVQSS